MATKITGLPRTRPITRDGILTQESGAYFDALTALAMIIGTGSPQGVVDARQGALYMDDTGVSGAILYIKQSDSVGGDRTLGWMLV